MKTAVALVALALSSGPRVSRAEDPAPTPQPFGERARPLADYLVAMHRKIHPLFTLGFLAGIDARKDPSYSDQTLWTMLAIVIDHDGSVARITSARPSGVPAFDAAAIASVQAAAPFPPPPPPIESTDGKVYLDWQFHRDARGCGTLGAEPHIYTIVADTSAHDASGAPAKPPAQLDDTGGAQLAAEGWFAAYARGDVPWLAGWSGVPFVADGEVVARDAAALKKLYQDMIAGTTGARAVTELRVLTPDAMDEARGVLPSRSARSVRRYAIGHVAGKELILLLQKTSKGWRVGGLDRTVAERPLDAR